MRSSQTSLSSSLRLAPVSPLSSRLANLHRRMVCAVKDQDIPPRAIKKLVIVSPVFNDWDAFGELVERLGVLQEIRDHEVHLIAVDDCSSEPADAASLNSRRGHLVGVRV